MHGQKNIKTYFMFNNVSFNRAVYEIMWKYIVEPHRPQVTIWRMLMACWIPKATNTLSQDIILIPFQLQQWLHERASILRCMYIPRLILFVMVHPCFLWV